MRYPSGLMGVPLKEAKAEIAARKKKEAVEAERWRLTEDQIEQLDTLRRAPGMDALIRYLHLQKDSYMRQWYGTNPEKSVDIAALQAKCHTYEELIELLTTEELKDAV